MSDLSICVFCKKSNDIDIGMKSSGNIILFTEESLKKCESILIVRKKHNLKYNDVILPVEYTESGYHRGCYKQFTGLMKKYLACDSTKQSGSASSENLSTASLSAAELAIEQSSFASLSSETSSLYEFTSKAPPIEPTTFRKKKK